MTIQSQISRLIPGHYDVFAGLDVDKKSMAVIFTGIDLDIHLAVDRAGRLATTSNLALKSRLSALRSNQYAVVVGRSVAASKLVVEVRPLASVADRARPVLKS